MRLVFLLFALLPLLACTPARYSPDADVDAAQQGDASARDGVARPSDAAADVAPDLAARACANLRACGCPEGLDPTCSDVLRHAALGTFDMKAACIADAGTRDAVRACGTVRCRVDGG